LQSNTGEKVALTIAEVEQELQEPWATRLCASRNPSYAIGGQPQRVRASGLRISIESIVSRNGWRSNTK
jgi:hypothetical protein